MTALSATGWHARGRELAPGLLASGMVAAAATFLAEHYGAPVMLLALLLGMSMNFLSADSPAAPGIEFLATPDNGDRPGETDGLRTSTFLKEHRLQLAINAAPFAPIHKDEGQQQDVVGLQVSRGKLVSPGFINTHVHSAGNGGDYLLLDMAKNDYRTSNYMAFAAPLKGKMSPPPAESTAAIRAFVLLHALNTVLSFSNVPIRALSLTGAAVALAGFTYAASVFLRFSLLGHGANGWPNRRAAGASRTE